MHAFVMGARCRLKVVTVVVDAVRLFELGEIRRGTTEGEDSCAADKACSLSKTSVRVSSPVKETVSRETFWLQGGPGIWQAAVLPMRHGAAPHCNSATTRH